MLEASPAVAGRTIRSYLTSFWIPTTALGLVGAALRLQFSNLPVTTDEAGYAEVARLWSHGAVLYRDIWVDRPQPLLLVFRLVAAIDDSVTAMRVLAALLGVLLTIGAALVARELLDDRAAVATAALVALLGLSPFVEAFVLNGELIAAVPATFGVWCFVRYLATRQPGLLVAAGLLGGTAVMVKQSAFDGLLACCAYLVWRERRTAVVPAAAMALAALAPVLVCVLTAPSARDWWQAVVAYRGEGDSLVTGSPSTRLLLFVTSASALSRALGVLMVLAFIGRRRTPLLVKFWIAGAVVGILGGGNFHAHYYIQLVAPVALAAAVGLRES